jgi:hypothetical protein
MPAKTPPPPPPRWSKPAQNFTVTTTVTFSMTETTSSASHMEVVMDNILLFYRDIGLWLEN